MNSSSHQILQTFLQTLDQGGKIQAEYIWVGGNGELRSKCRTLEAKSCGYLAEDLPEWNYDGSSTNQATCDDSEVILKPRAIFRDPFRRGENILVLCDTYSSSGQPLQTNLRAPAKEIFDQCLEEKPWFGLEQEYFLLDATGKKPLGWPENGYPSPQGPYYCSVGTGNAIGRDIVEAHYKCCLYSGVTISGINAEVCPSQWEFQVGPVEGIAAGDHMWIARYLLVRVAEMFHAQVNFEPKPVEGDWNGSGCHTNFSTLAMRKEGGLRAIEIAIKKLSVKHKEHISVYGTGNEKRLTGKHETSSMETFSWGVANRGTSIRVGSQIVKDGKGYLEDRRPSSNVDPYVVSSMLVKTVCLDKITSGQGQCNLHQNIVQ